MNFRATSVTYKQAYVEAFNTAYPNVAVNVTGPNKRGLHKVELNGEAGDIRLSESEVKEATRMLQDRGPASLSACIPANRYRLQDVAKFVNR